MSIRFVSLEEKMLNVAAGERTSKRRKSRSLVVGNSATHDSTARRSSEQTLDSSTRTDYSQPFDNFKHIIYEKAALIYVHLKGESDTILPTFEDERVKRRAYSLAFGAKKYESVLNDILLDSYFFSSYFKLESYYRNHVMVMLLDYQQNDFQFGNARTRQYKPDEKDILPHIAEIQEALETFYIKLRASLARNRIRECALTVEDLLPTEEKEKNDYVCHQPIYAYVNSLRSSIEEVYDLLQNSGFSKVDSIGNYSEFSGNCFAMDVHLPDLIVFPRDVKFDVYNHDLVQRGFLVVQDKSRCAAPEVVRSVLFQMTLAKEKAASLIPGEIRPVFNDGDDVIVVNSDSVNLIARLSCYVHPQRSLFVFGVKSDRLEDLHSMLDILGARNVTLIEENFLQSLPNDERFRKVRVVVYNALCSKSGVISPVDYVLQEGPTCVHDLVNGVHSNKLRGLAVKHEEVLQHAMQFYFVQYIVYFTSSVHNCENEDVIKKVIEESNTNNNDGENNIKRRGNPFIVSSFQTELTEKLRTFKAPGLENELTLSNSGVEKYLKLNRQMGVNGGFVCLLQRQKLYDSTNDVLERAAKKGLMKGTKRGKKSPFPVSKVLSDTQENDFAEQLETLTVETSDEKEAEPPSVKEKRSKSRRKKNEPKPFIFK